MPVMLILFIRHGDAFLPEVEAYRKFFSGIGVSCEEVSARDLNRIECDVEWHIMGFDRGDKRHGVYRIHDYASASVPPIRKVKDLLKRWFNAKPDYRLYLNEYVRRQLGFEDEVPFGFRDMGVNAGSKPMVTNKEYDFIFVGEIAPLRRGFRNWISAFTEGALKGRSLLVVSKSYERVATALRRYGNIHFVGPIPHNQVRNLISSARFGLNLMPNTQPFSHQTSTKLLEYASVGLPVITTDYKWVREFQERYGGKYFYVMPDFTNLNWASIINFNYRNPDLSEFKWERQICNSGVLKFLQLKFPHAICDTTSEVRCDYVPTG